MKAALHLSAVLSLIAATTQAEVAFIKHVIDPAFRAEACAAADLNNDGRIDIIAGQFWYEAPTWKPRVFRTVALTDGYADVRLDIPADVNRDGLTDLITVRRSKAMQWLENPGGQAGLWTLHEIGESLATEGVIVGDINRDGCIDLIGPTDPWGAGIAWWDVAITPFRPWKPADAKRRASFPAAGIEAPYAPWPHYRIALACGGEHGLGIGDVNRDGRPDILTTCGWYEAPEDPRQPNWLLHHHSRDNTHHQVLYDFDGDGDQDIAASKPHDYGLWWWAQRADDAGNLHWDRHLIDDTISQLHDLVSVDIDGDGDHDLLTGKRYKAHHGRDPGTDDPALLVWYELSRDGQTATFTRHIIDDDSGLGYVVTPMDIDRDGDMDILSANQKGVFLFEQAGSPDMLPLFNGKDLDNWQGDRNIWSAQDGMIVGHTDTGLKHNNFLVSKVTYDDFVLTFDIRLQPETANSGIQFRSTPREHGEVEGYQADVGKKWWGCIYEELGRGKLHDGYANRGERAVVPNDWNHYVIYAAGPELRVEINGTVCTHLTDTQRKTGIIAFQVHSGGPTDVRFRDIRMRRMK